MTGKENDDGSGGSQAHVYGINRRYAGLNGIDQAPHISVSPPGENIYNMHDGLLRS